MGDLAKLLHIDATTAGWITIAIVTAVGALFFWGIWWLWWRFPKWQMRSVTASAPKERADIEDNFRKTIGQALGGAAALIAAVFAYLQFTNQQQAIRAQLQSQHDLLISNQVLKGFEQLGSDKLAVRLGGIYALEGVMNASDQYQQSVVEALCAFVRGSTTSESRPASDVQAALTVIGRRAGGPVVVDLHGARIPGADLLGADLPLASLYEANMSGALLANADLRGASLIGDDLTGTDLAHADLSTFELTADQMSDFMRRKFVIENTTGRAAIGHKEFFRIRASLAHANLRGTNLTDANLRGVDSLTQAQLDEACGMHVTLPDGSIRDLRRCNPEATP